MDRVELMRQAFAAYREGRLDAGQAFHGDGYPSRDANLGAASDREPALAVNGVTVRFGANVPAVVQVHLESDIPSARRIRHGSDRLVATVGPERF